MTIKKNRLETFLKNMKDEEFLERRTETRVKLTRERLKDKDPFEGSRY